jgi:type VI secretion system secreted protein Hcp
MAYEFYVTIKGTKQGAFKGESIVAQHKDKVAGIAFRYSVKAPRDAATGLASGRRTHQPVTFVKEWGASSPQIFQALVTNEILSEVLFEFYKTTDTGEGEVYHTVKLINATVAELEQFCDNDAKKDVQHDTHELERVSFTFQRIEIESLTGQTAAIDDWTKH